MARTPSNMLPLGTLAPDFALLSPRISANESLGDLSGKHATVILFICNHCPYVVHIQAGIVQLAHDYADKGVALIAINANDIVHYPDDSPEKMIETAEHYQYCFPYLFDASQATAKAYDAACTPDCYVFDSKLALAYRGQFDGARPGNDAPVDGHSIRHALDALLAGNPLDEADQKPSMGCNIKWQAP